MSGEWIKIELTLPNKPEVIRIGRALGLSADAVCGVLIRFWGWASSNSVDGFVADMTAADVDLIVSLPGFAEALMLVGWLQQDSAAMRLTLPNFARHNVESAKKRSQTARRVAEHRERLSNANVTQRVTRNVLPRPIISAVRERDKATCRYCGRPEGKYSPPETMGDAFLTMDHVIPLSVGGSDEIQNLVCACSVCNLFKSNRTPEECGLAWPTNEKGERLGKRSCNAPHVTPASPEKRREEKNKDTVRASRFSTETLPLEWKTYCNEKRPDLMPESVFEDFRDYWIAQAGQRGVKLDWFATWRTWVRKQNPALKGNGAEPVKSCAKCHGSLDAGFTKRREGLICNQCEAQ